MVNFVQLYDIILNNLPEAVQCGSSRWLISLSFLQQMPITSKVISKDTCVDDVEITSSNGFLSCP